MKDLKIEIINGCEKYFCEIRKSYIPVTPEEEVRQNFLKYLIEEKRFPKSKIRVEQSLAHFGKGIRRVDILVLDENDNPFIIYECKKPFEPITDDILEQIQYYHEQLDTVEYLGLVIGNDCRFIGRSDKGEVIVFAEHPDYFTLIYGGEVSIIEPKHFEYQRYNWKKPINEETIIELVNYGVIGEGTHNKYHSFLINLDGWLLDQNDKLNLGENIEDIGIKITKFGNAGGGFFAKEFRSFLVKNRKNKPIICIALTSMVSGKNSPIRTTIYVGVETTKEKNSSLQIQVEKSVQIIGEKVIIAHNGTITVGRYGTAKKHDLLQFVAERKPCLIKNGLVYLGEFNENEEINSQNVGPFIKNLIDYALLRNEFRELRKQAVANNGS